MKNTFYMIILSMRPKQWIKNSFVFAALLFSQNLTNLRLLITSIEAFVTFCFVSVGVYLLNDLLDIEADKNHPKKSLRPLASGKLNPFVAKIGLVVIFTVSLTASYLINAFFSAIVLLYIVVQVAYSSFLKNVVIMDVFCIAGGFFLRVIGGAEAIAVPVSSWLLVCTIFISLFLGLTKRRHEIVLLSTEAGKHRKVLEEYNSNFLDQLIGIVTAGTVISYSLYTLSIETVTKFSTDKLWFTIPIVLYGVFRYLYLVYCKGEGGNPEIVLLGDKHLVGCILLYIVFVGAVLYL
jgi:4-hydroxybenzoate polyprenyltransferase